MEAERDIIGDVMAQSDVDAGVIEIVGVPYPRVLRSGDVHDCRGTGARGEGLYKDRIRCTGDRRSGVILALHAAGHG